MSTKQSIAANAIHTGTLYIWFRDFSWFFLPTLLPLVSHFSTLLYKKAWSNWDIVRAEHDLLARTLAECAASGGVSIVTASIVVKERRRRSNLQMVISRKHQSHALHGREARGKQTRRSKTERAREETLAARKGDADSRVKDRGEREQKRERGPR